jgi:hypothetical protein
MTEFLDELQRELLRAAERRTESSAATRTGWRARSALWLGDLGALGSGAMMAVSAGVVAVVVAVVAVSGVQRSIRQRGAPPSAASHSGLGRGLTCGLTGAATEARWKRASRAPRAGLSGLLNVGRRATGAERRVALRDLDQTVAQATVVYADDVRIVRLTDGVRITLVGTRACATIGLPGVAPRLSGPQPSVVSEIRSVHGVATIPLGTAAQIRSGTAARELPLLLRSGRGPESIAMVPRGVVRLVCHDLARGGATQRFPVVDRLAVISGVSADSHCNLVRRT